MPPNPSAPVLTTSMVPTISTVSLFDARPFFEKALQYGIQSGIIDAQKLDAMGVDAPKGMVQIARYFGTEFLRPELEKARDRLVNLVSLYLESTTGGDLRQAAESLRDHSFLSRSKGGSDMLKALIAMPQNSHFGMSERGGFTDEHIPLLAKWSLRSLPDYQVELAMRRQVMQVMDAAIWLADALGMDATELEEAGKDAEAVIRTALLVLACGRTDMPDWIAFEKMVVALRQKAALKPVVFKNSIPKGLPEDLAEVVATVQQSVLADLPKILDATWPVRRLFDQTPAFMGRYFWVEDALSEIDNHDRLASNAWHKTTGGNSDDGSLLTLFLCVAAGSKPQTLLTEKSAGVLIRKIQKSGLKPEVVDDYLLAHAPAEYLDGYRQLWADFVEEAEHTLRSDAVHALNDALALLRRECNVK